ncbi:MAG: N-acetylmuramoyl-L-alanine amidase [Firmicutes bacterium]|nr:N-acetylmuramoyl-L-alanine amidase [Bacillota bacterium]
MARTWQGAIIHHSASPASTTTMADIDRWHRERGWRGIGYHWGIYPTGQVERGRPDDQDGAHAGQPWNRTHLGIVLIGNFEHQPPTSEQYQALRDLLDRLEFGREKVKLHRGVSATSCPGRLFEFEQVWREAGVQPGPARIRVFVADQELNTQAVRVEGKIYLPIRDVGEALGARVHWERVGGEEIVRIEPGL